MEQFVSWLMSVAIFFAIVYAIFQALGRAILEPIHKKLDRLLELQERSLEAAPGSPAPGGADHGRRKTDDRH